MSKETTSMSTPSTQRHPDPPSVPRADLPTTAAALADWLAYHANHPEQPLADLPTISSAIAESGVNR